MRKAGTFVGVTLIVGAVVALVILTIADAFGARPPLIVAVVVLGLLVGAFVAGVSFAAAAQRRQGKSWPVAIGKGIVIALAEVISLP